MIERKIQKIEELVNNRVEEWPVRGESWHKFNLEVDALFDEVKTEVAQELKAKEFNADKIIANTKFVENPVVVCGNMKSGTTLITQLLDNHENLFVLPGDSHIFQKYKNFQSNEELCKIWLKRIFMPTGQKPVLPYGRNFDIYKNFIRNFQYLKQKKVPTHKNIVISFAGSVEKKIANLKHWIEKTPTNELIASEILQENPNAKFIHIIRNPFANIASLKKLDKIRGWKSTTLTKTLFFRYLLDKASDNKHNIENYFIVKYENLLKEPKKTMTQISNFLDIDFSEQLLSPTTNGVLATANSMYADKRVEGKINSNYNINKSLKVLDKLEKIIIYNTLKNSKTVSEYYDFESEELKKYEHKLVAKTMNVLYFFYKKYRKFFK